MRAQRIRAQRIRALRVLPHPWPDRRHPAIRAIPAGAAHAPTHGTRRRIATIAATVFADVGLGPASGSTVDRRRVQPTSEQRSGPGRFSARCPACLRELVAATGYRVRVTRSTLALAALANAAVKGLTPVGVRPVPAPGTDFDTAVVTDAGGNEWTVRAPRRPAVGAALESELALLERLNDPVDVLLPFKVPMPTGSVALPEGGRAVVYQYLPGRPLHPGDLQPGPGLAASLGRALAALHEVPASVVESVGLPVYTAEEYRDRRLAEVDAAAETSHVPSRLLTRWERALEEVSRWKFTTTVTHGDLVATHVLAEDDEVVGILDWSEAKVADPADDLAWIAVGADESSLDAVLESYSVARSQTPDRSLAARARLAGELALARWLLHGTRQDSPEIIEDAIGMLEDLASDVGDEPLE